MINLLTYHADYTGLSHILEDTEDTIGVHLDKQGLVQLANQEHGWCTFLNFFNIEDAIERYDSLLTNRMFVNEHQKGKSHIFLDNVGEGTTETFYDEVHDFCEKYDLRSGQVYYINGSTAIEEVIDKFSADRPIKIQGVYANMFQHLYAGYAKDYVKLNSKNKPFKYLSLNRMIKTHRSALVTLLYDRGLIPKGNVSFFTNDQYHELDRYQIAMFFDDDWKHQDTFAEMYKELPYVVDFKQENNDVHPMSLFTFNKLYDSAYFNVITESNYDNDNYPFFTEKTFKSILEKQPFIIVGPHSSLKDLRGMGYQTFPFINEEYDEETDGVERMEKIIAEVERLCNISNEEWDNILVEHADIFEHNYNVMLNFHENYETIKDIFRKVSE